MIIKRTFWKYIAIMCIQLLKCHVHDTKHTSLLECSYLLYSNISQLQKIFLFVEHLIHHNTFLQGALDSLFQIEETGWRQSMWTCLHFKTTIYIAETRMWCIKDMVHILRYCISCNIVYQLQVQLPLILYAHHTNYRLWLWMC